MEKLIKSLPAILAASGGAQEVAEAACAAAWKHAAGDALSLHAITLKLQESTLVVAVADQIWKKQLEQLRSQLLYRLNSILGQQVVTSIQLSVRPDKFRTQKAAEPPVSNATIPIELLSAAAAIDDPHLRRAFLGAAVSCVNRIEKV